MGLIGVGGAAVADAAVDAGAVAADAGLTGAALAGTDAAAASFGLGETGIAAGLGADAAADAGLAGAGLADAGLAGADAAGTALGLGSDLAGAAPAVAEGVTSVGSGLATAAPAELNTVADLGAPLAAAGPSALTVAAPAGTGLTDLTAGLGAVPAGTELAAPDVAALNAQLGLAPAAGETANIGAVASAPGAIATGADAQTAADLTQGLGSGFISSGAPGSGLLADGTAATTANQAIAGAAGSGLGSAPLGSVDTAAITGSGLTTAPVASSQGGILSSISSGWDTLTNAINSPTGKVLGVGLAGAGLLKDLMAPSTPKGLNAIASEAAAAQQQGSILQSYLETGTLPPAVQASVNAATKSGITAIKAKYASMGVAPGSQGEIQDINNLQQQAVIDGATLADQLLQQGISETQLSGTLYNDLVQYNTSLNTQTGSAIANLASALAGGGNTITIKSG